MRHGSLFSGLGGFDYAAQQMNWENVFHCEINPFCQTILKHYWPHAKSFTDIFEFDGTAWRGKVDIITAGFPCQPFSHAGKRKGSTDDRFIWPENMRIFREAKPKWVVCENVPGLLTIASGMVFEKVCADLENEGYEVQPFIIPACAKDAVHRRDRVWIVANRNGQLSGRIAGINGGTQEEKQLQERNEIQRIEQPDSVYVTNTQRTGLERQNTEGNTPAERRNSKHIISGENWLEVATRLCILDDGTTGRLDIASISKGKWRTESLKAYGNAIFWPIAYEIFKAIENYAEKMD